MSVPHLSLHDFTYPLPDARIARFPAEPRHNARLLVCRGQQLSHHTFADLPALLPDNTLLVFNDTRVIPARLPFVRESGGGVEVFLLHPVAPTAVLSEAMGQPSPVTWEAMVGNRKRWRAGEVLTHRQNDLTVTARWANADRHHVTLSWTPTGRPFVAVVEAMGQVPLPPYLKRPAHPNDRARYQTVYAARSGAVAAPTAGLHFTPQVMAALADRGVDTGFVTLHVGAGTFQPVQTANAADHPMHAEQVVVSRPLLARLLNHPGPVVAVGTTSLRTLESLYWFGAQLARRPDAPFHVARHLPYQLSDPPDLPTALRAVDEALARRGLDELVGETEVYLLPGYRFRVVRGLVTNFHQPGSTLMLLVAAFLGQPPNGTPTWRRVYAAALAGDYRFLSYGDSSLLLPD